MSNKNNECVNTRIISLDASEIYRLTHCFDSEKTGLSFRKNGKILYEKYTGFLDYSLEIEKLKTVFSKHKSQFPDKEFWIEKNGEKYPYSPYIVNVSFQHDCEEFHRIPGESTDWYVRFGYSFNKDDMPEDHSEIRHTPDGDILVAIETLKKAECDSGYEKVHSKLNDSLLDPYFIYESGYYKRTSKTIGLIKTKSPDDKADCRGLRHYLYKNGFDMDGIHYVRYKRSAGSSREGNCLFIAEPLYEDMMKWSRCGLPEEAKKTSFVSWEAYIALTLSSIQDTLPLRKNAFLILPEDGRIFNEKVVNVKYAADGKTLTSEIEDVNGIKNKIFDGEGLLDTSVFETLGAEYSKCGMLLLRNRFFKTCAFRTNLQQWFKDNNITKISELNGFTTAKEIEQIKIVVTVSSIKYFKFAKQDEKNSEKKESSKKSEVKFKKTAGEYLDNLYYDPLSSQSTTKLEFGIVKTDKPTGHMGGELVRTSYQLLNTLGFTKEEVDELYRDSLDYWIKIGSSPMYMRYHLHLNNNQNNEITDFEPESDEDTGTDINMEAGKESAIDTAEGEEPDANTEEDEKTSCLTDFDDDPSYEKTLEDSDFNYNNMVMDLLQRSDLFAETEFYKSFRKRIHDSFRDMIRHGRILIRGTNATIFGNGLTLLNQTLRNPLSDLPELQNNEIYINKFPAGTKLLCARSPHITMGNLLLSTNTKNDWYDRYFVLSPQIVCVNAIGNNIQYRLNGCDYDSDTMLVTDNPLMVKVAERDQSKFLVPYPEIDTTNTKTESGDIPLYEADHTIANNKVGDIVNVSQYLNCIYWDICKQDPEKAEELYKAICILAVLSGMEIDKAKRPTSVNISSEINKVKRDNKFPGENSRPKFYQYMIGGKLKRCIAASMDTTMCYVFDLVDKKSANSTECQNSNCPKKDAKSSTSLLDLFNLPGKASRDNKTIEEICHNVDECKKKIDNEQRKIRQKQGDSSYHHERINTYKKECIDYIARILKRTNEFVRLLQIVDDNENTLIHSKNFLLACLYFAKKDLFLSLLKPDSYPRYRIVRGAPADTDPPILIYGIEHHKESLS